MPSPQYRSVNPCLGLGYRQVNNGFKVTKHRKAGNRKANLQSSENREECIEKNRPNHQKMRRAHILTNWPNYVHISLYYGLLRHQSHANLLQSPEKLWRKIKTFKTKEREGYIKPSKTAAAATKNGQSPTPPQWKKASPALKRRKLIQCKMLESWGFPGP